MSASAHTSTARHPFTSDAVVITGSACSPSAPETTSTAFRACPDVPTKVRSHVCPAHLPPAPPDRYICCPEKGAIVRTAIPHAPTKISTSDLFKNCHCTSSAVHRTPHKLPHAALRPAIFATISCHCRAVTAINFLHSTGQLISGFRKGNNSDNTHALSITVSLC